MKFLRKTKAFTLIELMVVISILAILIIGASNINFNRINKDQELDLFVNKIITDIETLRNDELMGRATLSWSTMVHPQARAYFFSTKSTGVKVKWITLSHDRDWSSNLGNWKPPVGMMKIIDYRNDWKIDSYPNMNITHGDKKYENFTIEKISCLKSNDVEVTAIPDTRWAAIIFYKDKIDITDINYNSESFYACSKHTVSKVAITVQGKNGTQRTITFNSLNGLSEVK